ncbi:hypothetical protein CH365_15960 [Leptospira neocaledonica]|uniref:Uncharacterized protein n=1 Tax=Leptospira neocaledonica TaxID=2023192 RepID=A0A2M9ZV03_9LEPT|nr:hypothetical protein CH365_15960 [Leptospira neocaledonica]
MFPYCKDRPKKGSGFAVKGGQTRKSIVYRRKFRHSWRKFQISTCKNLKDAAFGDTPAPI